VGDTRRLCGELATPKHEVHGERKLNSIRLFWATAP
jgi:hypothetical protein